MQLKLACNAMATRFELILYGEKETALRSAGEEAIEEIQRWDRQLNLYNPSSDASRINAQAHRKPVKVDAEMFGLLKHCRRISERTGGAFDITVHPLMECWGFRQQSGSFPEPQAVESARQKTGMEKLFLDESRHSVVFEKEGMQLDFGGVGKGFALDRAAEILTELEIQRALIHGGTSTILALGSPEDQDGWRIAIEHPISKTDPSKTRIVGSILIKDAALSISAVWGKAFEKDGKVYGHVIDPRTGWPAQGAALAAVQSASATETDALSTALLVEGLRGVESMQRQWPVLGFLAMRERDEDEDQGEGFEIECSGIQFSVQRPAN